MPATLSIIAAEAYFRRCRQFALIEDHADAAAAAWIAAEVPFRRLMLPPTR